MVHLTLNITLIMRIFAVILVIIFAFALLSL